jgi:hypothetical protein
VRNGAEAVRLAESAKDSAPDNPEALDTLAAAYAEDGQFARASAMAVRALELAKTQGIQELVKEIRTRQLLYAKNKPFHGERTPTGTRQAKVTTQASRESQ